MDVRGTRRLAGCFLYFLDRFATLAWQLSPLKVCFSLVYVLRPAGSIRQILLGQRVNDNIFLPLGSLFMISLPPWRS